MRARGRLDQNHVEIVKALRQAGASVQSLASIGKGCPDLLVCCGSQLYLMEIKDGTKTASRRRLSDDEYAWQAKWPGNVYVVTSVAQALAIIGIRDPLERLGEIAGERMAKAPW